MKQDPKIETEIDINHKLETSNLSKGTASVKETFSAKLKSVEPNLIPIDNKPRERLSSFNIKRADKTVDEAASREG